MKQPVINKVLDYNYFGNMDITRGTGILIEPPIKHEDNYKWIRDDTRSNTDVINMLNNENEYTKFINNHKKSIENEINSKGKKKK